MKFNCVNNWLIIIFLYMMHHATYGKRPLQLFILGPDLTISIENIWLSCFGLGETSHEICRKKYLVFFAYGGEGGRIGKYCNWLYDLSLEMLWVISFICHLNYVVHSHGVMIVSQPERVPFPGPLNIVLLTVKKITSSQFI